MPLIDFVRPSDEKIFSIHLEVITISLRKHKFRQNFEDDLYLLCPCSIKSETKMRCFLCAAISAMKLWQTL